MDELHTSFKGRVVAKTTKFIVVITVKQGDFHLVKRLEFDSLQALLLRIEEEAQWLRPGVTLTITIDQL